MEEISITMDQIPVFQNHYYKKMSRTIKKQSGSGRTVTIPCPNIGGALCSVRRFFSTFLSIKPFKS